jgi:hypothetical protein
MSDAGSNHPYNNETFERFTLNALVVDINTKVVSQATRFAFGRSDRPLRSVGNRLGS